jgi:hypothetical protein
MSTAVSRIITVVCVIGSMLPVIVMGYKFVALLFRQKYAPITKISVRNKTNEIVELDIKNSAPDNLQQILSYLLENKDTYRL